MYYTLPLPVPVWKSYNNPVRSENLKRKHLMVFNDLEPLEVDLCRRLPSSNPKPIILLNYTKETKNVNKCFKGQKPNLNTCQSL